MPFIRILFRAKALRDIHLSEQSGAPAVALEMHREVAPVAGGHHLHGRLTPQATLQMERGLSGSHRPHSSGPACHHTTALAFSDKHCFSM